MIKDISICPPHDYLVSESRFSSYHQRYLHQHAGILSRHHSSSRRHAPRRRQRMRKDLLAHDLHSSILIYSSKIRQGNNRWTVITVRTALRHKRLLLLCNRKIRMPSIILTGYPCSGKTTFSHLLAERAIQHKSQSIEHVIIVNEELARPGLTKPLCYENSNAEKFTRAALKAEFDKYCRSSSIKSLPSSIFVKSAVDRISKEACITKNNTLVILDSMNYIKGYRYELHCIAKSAGQKHAVIWLLCSQELAKTWNIKRRRGEDTHTESDNAYSDQLMDELIQRFEPPDQRNRWDQPLYRVEVDAILSGNNQDTDHVLNGDMKKNTGDIAEDILNRSVYNMHSLRDSISDESQTSVRISKANFRRVGQLNNSTYPSTVLKDTTPMDHLSTASSHIHDTNLSQPVRTMEEIIDDILDSFISDVQHLKQGLSTKADVAANVNVLNNVDSICQEVINAFMHLQKIYILSLGSGGKVSVPISDSKTFTMDCKRPVQLIELRRFMRQYIKLVSTHPPTDTSKDGISVSFLKYISSQL